MPLDLVPHCPRGRHSNGSPKRTTPRWPRSPASPSALPRGKRLTRSAGNSPPALTGNSRRAKTPKRPNGGRPKNRRAKTPKRPNGGRPKNRRAKTPKRPNGGRPKNRRAKTPKRPNGGRPKNRRGAKPKRPNGGRPKNKQHSRNLSFRPWPWTSGASGSAADHHRVGSGWSAAATSTYGSPQRPSGFRSSVSATPSR